MYKLPFFFTLFIAVSGCQSSEPSQEPPPSERQKTDPIVDNKEKNTQNVFLQEACTQFVDCACPLEEHLVSITGRDVDQEQCRAAKQMTSLGDMSQGCTLGLQQLRTQLQTHAQQVTRLGIQLPSACQQP